MINTAKNFFVMLNNLQKIHLKLLPTAGNLIGNKIADGITTFSKTLQQNNSEVITKEHDKEIPKELYISRKQTRNC